MDSINGLIIAILNDRELMSKEYQNFKKYFENFLKKRHDFLFFEPLVTKLPRAKGLFFFLIPFVIVALHHLGMK